MLATFTTEVEGGETGVLIAVGAAFLLLYLLPAILVALRADTEGFSMWGFLFVALSLGWPIALALALIFGRQSPLVASHHSRGYDAPTRVGGAAGPSG